MMQIFQRLCTGDFVRVRRRNWQSEVSLWWTPDPLSVAVSWNHTETQYKSVDPTTFDGTTDSGRNDRVEFILWFSF